jgi:hypothetical protein
VGTSTKKKPAQAGFFDARDARRALATVCPTENRNYVTVLSGKTLHFNEFYQSRSGF